VWGVVGGLDEGGKGVSGKGSVRMWERGVGGGVGFCGGAKAGMRA